MISLVYILLSVLFILFPQDSGNKSEKKIDGIMHSADGVVFILGNEYYKLESNDFYQDYYRRIYNDSTIVNPNTEIKSNYNLKFIPFIGDINSVNKRYNFDKPLELGLFLNLNDDGSFNLTQYGTEIIDSLFNK